MKNANTNVNSFKVLVFELIIYLKGRRISRETKRMAKKSGNELYGFTEYLRGESSEKAKQHLLYPFFISLFKDKFKIETDAHGADVYVEGQLIVESKTNYTQWLEGFYQALHYRKKFGLSYHTIVVVAHKFVGIWKLNKLPEYATILANTVNASDAPSTVGKENAKKTQPLNKKEIKEAAFYWLEPKSLEGELFVTAKNLTTESFEIERIFKNLESERIMINPHNFIHTIERMKSFFHNPIDAVHAFYAIAPFWDITSTLPDRPNGAVAMVGYHGNKLSEDIIIPPNQIYEFRKFVETKYIFTNGGSGLTVDYYFSRFDEVLAEIDPEYVKQHGIFFTNDNLSRFASWFAQHHFPGDINDNYIFFDPAGGSGNLVCSWRGKLKHKIISELQPDLLRTIERRMNADPFHSETGHNFTIVPKTIDNKGLNFLDKGAEEYMAELQNVLSQKNVAMDKPLAFLLNPPYKNTDENEVARKNKESNYELHPSILELTGEDAGKERYLAFLGQILNISKLQHTQNPVLKPVVMIFTPTSWLIPRPTYMNFRKEWDNHFKFHSGFIVTSNEFFKLDGKWPLAFTIWVYDEEEKENHVNLFDFTGLHKNSLAISWNEEEKNIEAVLKEVVKGAKNINYNNSRGSIKDWVGQSMYDFKRDPTQTEINSGKVFGGLPIKDLRRKNKKTYGISDSSFIGFMDDNTPCRVKQDNLNRFSTKPDKIWFQLRPTFLEINLTKIMGGAPDKYGYGAYDLDSAKKTFTWFVINKTVNGVYPVWANQYDIWRPNIPKEKENLWYALCFSFVLAENRCVVTKFEKDNPVTGAPEVFVDNPLCPANKESFWSTTLDEFVTKQTDKDGLANQLVNKIKELYKAWNTNYCKGQYKTNVGLHNEPYFKYFDYADFLTPYSGLIQIKKYSENEGLEDMTGLFKEVSELTKLVKKAIYEMLVVDFGYFE